MNEDSLKPAVAVQLVLTAAELSYLLQTFGATSLWGGDSSRLFPNSEEQNEALLAQGLADLKAHDWLRPSRDSKPGREAWDLDHNLVQIAVVVADPEIVIVTSRYVTPNEKEVACDYLTESTMVELVATADGSYRLLSLPTYTLLWERIGEALVLPQVGEGSPIRYHLDEASFLRIAQIAKSHTANNTAAVPSELATNERAILTLLTSIPRRAEVEIGRIFDRELQTGYSLTFLGGEEQVWLLYYDSPSTVVVQTVTLQEFATLLQTFVESLFAQQMEQNR